MVIRLGTGGDNQDHVSTPVSKRSRRFSVLSESRNHLEGTFEFPETKGDISQDKRENIIHSHHSSLSSN